MARQCVVGVDIGTQSTKALVVTDDGALLAHASRAYRPDTPRPLWAEQDPEVWLQAVVDSVREAVQRAREAHGGDAALQFRALCVTSLYGGSGIPVDAQARPLHPCLIWMDRRAQAQVDAIHRDVDVPRLMQITGNGVDSYYGYTKMMWLRDERLDVWRRTVALLPPNMWVNALFTGARGPQDFAVDHTSAGNLGGVYDVARRAWSDEACAMLGLPRGLLPQRLVQSSDVVGTLVAPWAGRLGLPVGTPCVAGGVDAAVATLAAGAARPGNHVAMIGTSMCWGTIRPHVDAADGLISMPHVFNGLHDLYVFGGAITAGASVAWFRDTFCQAEIAQAREHGDDPHRLLEAQAALLAPGSGGLLFLPYLMGERSPVWDARASGAFIGLGLDQQRGNLYRAVLEGVTYALRHNIEAGRRGAGTLDGHLVVVGGASHSDLWMQIIADVTGLPVHTLAADVEASLGAAVLALRGVGLIDDDRVRAGLVAAVERARPDEAAHRAYDALYAQYVASYPALKPVMHALRDAAAAGGDAAPSASPPAPA